MKKLILVVKRENVKKVKKWISCMLVIYITINIFLNIYTLYFENYVYFFNVEQGNMAIIRYKRKNILIDYGSTKESLASNILSNFLKSKAIKKIDLAVISHMHDDHMNGFLSEESEVEKIMYAYPKEETVNFEKIKEKADAKNISLIETELFETYNYNGINMIVLSPKKNKTIQAGDIANANSLVLLLSINNKNMLFMGDATKETEKEIMKKLQNLEDTNLKKDTEKRLENIDILQVGHHGSKTSTSEGFIQKITPKNAIISAKKEKYGHPHNETLDTLKKYNVNIYITENKGAIRFKL